MFFDMLLKRGVSLPQDGCRLSFLPVDLHEHPYVPYAPSTDLPPMYFMRLFSDDTPYENNQP